MDSNRDDAANSQLLWRVVWRRRKLVILISFLCAALATATSYLVTPRYRSQVVLIPAESGSGSGLLRGLGDLGGLAALAGVGGGKEDHVIEAMALLKSRQFTTDFISDQNLIPVLFPKDWDAASKKWKVAPDKVPTMGDAWEYFNNNVRSVSEDRKTGLVTLTIEWRDPEAAARWATELVHRLNGVMRSHAISESDASIEQLKARLAETNVVPLQQSIAELLEAQIKRRTFAAVRAEYAFRIVDPAVAPEKKYRVYPRRSLFLILGGMAGFLLAVLLVFVRDAMSARPARTAGT